MQVQPSIRAKYAQMMAVCNADWRSREVVEDSLVFSSMWAIVTMKYYILNAYKFVVAWRMTVQIGMMMCCACRILVFAICEAARQKGDFAEIHMSYFIQEYIQIRVKKGKKRNFYL